MVLLINGPIHYDFILPLDQITRDSFADLNLPINSFPQAENLVIGWGAEGFYTTVGGYRDVSFSAVGRGIFGDRSVMRVDLAGAIPADLGLRSIAMTERQYRAFLAAIKDSFADTQPFLTGTFTPTDAFYPAKGRFHILSTCNVWAGKMLRAAGIRFGIWTPLPLSITLSHALYHAE